MESLIKSNNLFDNWHIGVTHHAMRRFRERIDPTATVEQIIGYLRQAEVSAKITRMMAEYSYTLDDVFLMYRTIYATYKHVCFVVSKRDGGRSRSAVIVTCY